MKTERTPCQDDMRVSCYAPSLLTTSLRLEGNFRITDLKLEREEEREREKKREREKENEWKSSVLNVAWRHRVCVPHLWVYPSWFLPSFSRTKSSPSGQMKKKGGKEKWGFSFEPFILSITYCKQILIALAGFVLSNEAWKVVNWILFCYFECVWLQEKVANSHHGKE